MSIDKNNERWSIQIELKKAVEDIPVGVELFNVSIEAKKVVRMYKENDKFCFEMKTTTMENPLIMQAEASAGAKQLELVWLSYRAELWSNGELRDEEWPHGNCIYDGEAQIFCKDELLQVKMIDSANAKDPVYKEILNAQYWAPELGNHNVGDCMPFADKDTYHLFYLKDRHQHKSKWGKGAHQFAHISTKDMIHWQEHPVAVEITHQWEGSICTGSVIRAKNTYYAFYAVRMTDGSSAKVSYATSTDCIHFTKSEKYFTLTAPYETTSVRDPEVFYGADGLYHMLLTTNFEESYPEERNGCLAHMTSNDLINWVQKEPFLVPGFTDQPECCDYFKWNDWYYIIFSNYGTAKYRYSKEPFGPWICPENEMIDGLLYRVPKTADFKGRRIASGFLCINTEGESYAGNLVLREIIQNEDGTLGTCFVKEIIELEKDNVSKEEKEDFILFTGESGGYHQEKLLDCREYIKVQVEAEGNVGSYGLIMKAPDKKAYEIRIDPGQRTMGVYAAHSCLYYNPTKRILTGIDNLKEGCTIEVVLKNNILDICINEERTLICRMEDNWTVSNTEWGCFIKDGKARFNVIN